MAERKTGPYKIYPWNMSVTGEWTPAWLTFLKEQPVDAIIPVLRSSVSRDFQNAIAECYAHGYFRKAAEIARAMIKENPEMLEVLNSQTTEPVRKRLLNDPLEDIPANARELSKKIPIVYIN